MGESFENTGPPAEKTKILTNTGNPVSGEARIACTRVGSDGIGASGKCFSAIASATLTAAFIAVFFFVVVVVVFLFFLGARVTKGRRERNTKADGAISVKSSVTGAIKGPWEVIARGVGAAIVSATQTAAFIAIYA